MKRELLCLGLMSLFFGQPPANTPSIPLKPALATQAVGEDADDPAFWYHRTQPSKSLILGTNKTAAPQGALVVFDAQGKIKQTIANIDRPNNVDVEYGLKLRGKPVDIAVVTERLQRRLRVFMIKPDGSGLVDVSDLPGLRVFQNETGDASQPMGIALYKRPKDGAIFAIVSRKTGDSGRYLGQYRLMDNGKGKVKAVEVRRFGAFNGGNEIEAVAVDDELGYVYYSDEGFGVRKYYADPAMKNSKELATLATQGFQGDHEGIAIYQKPKGRGYLVITEQIDNGSRYHVYTREGSPGKPHAHRLLAVLTNGADSTDGIEIVSPAHATPRFKQGMLIAMNSRGKNFLIYDWMPIERQLVRR
ncbi:MAG: phytase [Fimbriimonadia bacterium]|nr:phytase [Fimbriimonadia bacterium]